MDSTRPQTYRQGSSRAVRPAALDRPGGGAVTDEIKTHDLLRRTFLRVLGASGLAVVGGRLLTRDPVTALRATAAPTIDGLTAFRGAMHVHSCFSEGAAACTSQLSEAARNGFDVFWPTDHDWRMSAYQAPTTFHFAALSETVATKKYTWTAATPGSASSVTGGIVKTPVSAQDTAKTKGSLKVEAVSKGSGGRLASLPAEPGRRATSAPTSPGRRSWSMSSPS